MLNIVESYKEIEVEIDGENRIIPINTSEAYKVIEIENGENVIKVCEGDSVKFCNEFGEEIIGIVEKITGSKGSPDIQLIERDSDHKTIWSISNIKDGSLKVLK